MIVATSANGTTVNSKGQVTALRPIQASELPVATATTLGVSKYPASGALVVDANGSVSLSQTAAGTGPHVKVLCDQYGRVTDSLPLTNDDLPALDATKITAVNQLTGSQLADDTITAKNLGDYTTCLMQEDFPGSSGGLLPGDDVVPAIHIPAAGLRPGIGRKPMGASWLRCTAGQQPAVGRHF